jgi:ADP-heptose:LPS heptosyltransferase
MKRNTAFSINGGAGRVMCSIPALELYEKENPDDDFIVMVEGFIDLFKGHPTLFKRSYEHTHRRIFEDKLKDMNVICPEPYYVWEYYNQQASIAQAFDIIINKKGLRDLPVPTMILSTEEKLGGIETVNKIRKDFNNKKAIVFQPFGRGSNIHNHSGITGLDMGGRSFSQEQAAKLIKRLQKKYCVIVMDEKQIDFKALGCEEVVPQLTGMTLRRWLGVIDASSYFLGCDSVGQHLAVSLGKPASVVLGSTFKENVSYPNNKKLDIIDLGQGKRMYSPIRICYDELADVNNEKLMNLTDKDFDRIVASIEAGITKV